jgi:L-iditol 2-dehydrogenase
VIGLAKLAPGAGNVALAERPVVAAGPGQVALSVEAVGVCGTDLHIEAGEYPSVPPVTIGHEVCGTVVELGEGADPDWLGARVVCETYYSTCGRCAMCRDGRANLCLERRSFGTHVDGAFAPRLVLPANNLHRVPEGYDSVAASLSEPLACVCHALLDPPVVSAGDHVLVIGPGAIGLLAAQVARSGGGRVTVQGAARDEARLELAASLGFDTLVAGADRAEDFEPPAVVVECSGAEPGIADALRTARRGGQLVQIGLRGADVTLPWDLICFHELTVTSGFASTPESWRRALALMRSRAVELGALVTEVVALDDWERAFAASREGRGVKFVLDPSGGSS